MASLTIKLFSLFALLLAVTATSTAFAEEDNLQCPLQTMLKGSLDSCRHYLMHKCGMTSYPMTYPMVQPQLTLLRQRCCMQLLSMMMPRCRCAAICQMVQYARQEVGGYYGGEGQMTRMAEMAAHLPSMCRMPPGYCEYGSCGAC